VFEGISIHAPTRGATGHFQQVEHIDLISIHAPTRGATAITGKLNRSLDISIHAPTRGATGRQSPYHGGGLDFNPRAHAGRDRICPSAGLTG